MPRPAHPWSLAPTPQYVRPSVGRFVILLDFFSRLWELTKRRDDIEVADIVADIVADKVADMVADMEVDKVADMFKTKCLMRSVPDLRVFY